MLHFDETSNIYYWVITKEEKFGGGCETGDIVVGKVTDVVE